MLITGCIDFGGKKTTVTIRLSGSCYQANVTYIGKSHNFNDRIVILPYTLSDELSDGDFWYVKAINMDGFMSYTSTTVSVYYNGILHEENTNSFINSLSGIIRD